MNRPVAIPCALVLTTLLMGVPSAAGAQRGEGSEAEYVVNPVAPRHADPWIYHHTDGHYYMTGSVPAYDRIEIIKAETIQGLAMAEPVVVWRKHDEGPMSRHIWAPELHYVDGKWYIHFAAGREDEPFAIRMYVLENDSPDPTRGEWVEKGRLETNWESFSLDATTFEHRGTRYLVWAQNDPEIEGNTNLYIAEMETPWTIRGEQVMLTYPEYEWERQGYLVNEGAAVLKRNGRIFITYSGSATDHRYAMGLLTSDADADLMDPESWTKSRWPVFRSSARNHVWGPGHNSFTTSKDGSEVLMVYHARPYREIEGNSLYDPNRMARVQRLEFDDDGTPLFGEPVPLGPHVIDPDPEGDDGR